VGWKCEKWCGGVVGVVRARRARGFTLAASGGGFDGYG